MKELHIKTGDIKRVIHHLQHQLKKKKIIKIENGIGNYNGLKILYDKYIPKNRAVLIGSKGYILKIWDI